MPGLFDPTPAGPKIAHFLGTYHPDGSMPGAYNHVRLCDGVMVPGFSGHHTRKGFLNRPYLERCKACEGHLLGPDDGSYPHDPGWSDIITTSYEVFEGRQP